MEIIRWFSDPAWSQQVVLGERTFIVKGRYNTRDESWYCDVIDSNEIPVVVGRRVTIGTDILEGVVAENAPNGSIIVTAVIEGVEEITRDNMGESVQLIFAEEDEEL